MASYPYVMSPDKVPGFFKRVTAMGVPSRLTQTTLKSIGFTSSNDARLISLVKFLGLVDGSGKPTDRWTELRKDQGLALAKGLREGYSDLFNHYPDAYQRDDEALRTYFSANSSVAADTVSKIVSTFKAVARLGDFGRLPDAANDGSQNRSEVVSGETPEAGPKARPLSRPQGDGVTVNINVQLQLPVEATAETYERFFEAMRKHLFST